MCALLSSIHMLIKLFKALVTKRECWLAFQSMQSLLNTRYGSQPILNWQARKMRSNCITHLLCSEDGRNAEAQRWPKRQITPPQVGVGMGAGVGRHSIGCFYQENVYFGRVEFSLSERICGQVKMIACNEWAISCEMPFSGACFRCQYFMGSD